METETYITSQGEIVRKPMDNKDAKAIEPPHEGVLSEIWHTVKDNAVAAAHVAEMAAVIAGEAVLSAKEATSEFMHGASEKVSEKTTELVSNLHVAERKIAEKPAGLQLAELAEIIIEQAKISADMAKQAKDTVVEAIPTSVKETASEVAQASVDMAMQAKEAIVEAMPAVKETATEVAQATVEKAIQAKDAVVDAIPESFKETASGVAQASTDMAIQAKDAVVDALPPSVTAKATEVAQVTQDKLSGAMQTAQEFAGEVAQKWTKDTALLRSQSEVVIPRQQREKTLRRSASKPSMESEGWKGTLTLTMDVVSHLQRIADRTGDAVLHETARKAHSACAKGLNEAPGVHLTWVTPQQANDLVNLAIRTQDHELADFARYCQSVAATSHIAVEPTPGKIQEEILKGHQELQQQGRIHTGPGYGAAFASVNKNYTATDGEPISASTPTTPSTSSPLNADAKPFTPQSLQQRKLERQVSAPQLTPPTLALNMDVVSHIQRIADRTGNSILHETARKAHSAFAKGTNEAPGVHLVWITPSQASELMNLASRTGDKELVDFARYCQSVAATTQIGVEPQPGKIQQEIFKGRMELATHLNVQSPEQSMQAGGGGL